jgi:hydroxymethylbilane synthase
MKIRIGSRGSDLALWQANHVRERLQSAGAEVEIIIYKTQGDKIQHLSLDKLEGKGFFTKELEDALLNSEIDLAVHSHKDLPTVSPEGLCIAGVSEREDPSELLIALPSAVDSKATLQLKQGASIGTSSARRKVQLHLIRNDLQLRDIRGNVPTRIQKLRDKQFDAILLAKAGVERLKIDLSEFVVSTLDPQEFIPAPAQGVLALQTREADEVLIKFIQNNLHDEQVANAIAIERKILNLFEGGCHMPMGAYVQQTTEHTKLWVSMADDENAKARRFFYQGATQHDLAEMAVAALKAQPLQGKKILITQEPKGNRFLQQQLQAMNASLESQSGIACKSIPFVEENLSADIVFFNSKNAVQHFFEQIAATQYPARVAAFGPGTAQALKNYVNDIEFIGRSSDPKIVAEQFLLQYPNSLEVLFPAAQDSFQSIAEQIKKQHNVRIISVYHTIALSLESFPACDLMVFTSASNVEAYATQFAEKLRTIPCIAIGPTTAEAMEKRGIIAKSIALRADDYGIMDAILEYFCK